MSRLIDAEKYERDLMKAYDDVSMEFEVLDKQPTVDAIIISKGATNGDVVKAMFPNLRLYSDFAYWDVDLGDTHISIDKKWWNAAYKGRC